MTYPVHTTETAPDTAKPTLAAAEKGFGFVPNLLGVMANAPALVSAYTTLSGIFDSASLNRAERQVVLLTTSYENDCAYCMAAHSAIAGMQSVPQEVIEGLRAGQSLADAKLEALRVFTRAVVVSRGWVSEAEKAAFFAAGYGEQQVLEVVLGVGLKTLSNYTNHIAETPLDAAFAPLTWSKAA